MTAAPVVLGRRGSRRRARAKLRRSSDQVWRWLTLGPAIALLTGLTLIPLAELCVLSVNKVSWRNAHPVLQGVGLANYAGLPHDTLFRAGIRNTIVFALVAVGFEVVLGLALALALSSVRRGRDLYVTVFMLPILLPGIVIGAIWALMYNPDFGIINASLAVLGIPPHDWLGTPELALASVIAVDVWHWTPFCFLLLYAAVESLPTDVFEAARIDGASAWQRCWHVALPLLVPAILVVLAFRAIIAFKVFDEVYLLTSGGPGTATEVISLTIYRRFFIEDNAGYGAAMSIAAFLAFGTAVVVLMRLLRGRAGR
jgi:multiple sugar transport system permease protein